MYLVKEGAVSGRHGMVEDAIAEPPLSTDCNRSVVGHVEGVHEIRSRWKWAGESMDRRITMASRKRDHEQASWGEGMEDRR